MKIWEDGNEAIAWGICALIAALALGGGFLLSAGH